MSSEIEIPGLPTSYPIPGVRGFPLTGQGVRSPQSRIRLMLVGQKVSMPSAQGTQASEATFEIPGDSTAAASAGYGSSVHRMARDLLKLFPLITLSGCLCDPDGAAVQASDTIVLSGDATESGYARLRLAGTLLSIPVANGDTAGTVQMAADAAIGKGIPGLKTASVTYDTAKTITFVPNVYGVKIEFVPDGGGHALTVTGNLAVIKFLAATTTYAEIAADWAGSPAALALASISGVAGTLPAGFALGAGLTLFEDTANFSDLPVYATEEESLTYETGKTISWIPNVADVTVNLNAGTPLSLTVTGTTATIVYIPNTTTYAEIAALWEASATAKALATIYGTHGVLPTGYTGNHALSLNDGTITLKAKTKGADQNDVKWTCHIEDATGILVDAGTSSSGALTGGTGESDWDGALDAIIDVDPSVYWAILPATCDTTVITSGVDALKNRIKLAGRPDVAKRMRAILGHTGTEAEAKVLSDAWEEGTQDDETGHRGRIVIGMGQTAEPWICAAGYAGMYTRAVSTRINKNPAEDPIIETLLVPASKGDGPVRADLVAALNDGLIPLVYDFDRNQTSILRSISAKHSTGGISDYRARPSVVSDVLDFVNEGLEVSLADIYRGFMITNDNADGTTPDRLPPKTTTPAHIKNKIFYLLKRDYFEPGYIDDVEALFNSMLVQRNGVITSRVDGDISTVSRRWLEQIFYVLREVGGEA
jgi:phage tail sheath gpL-like